MIIINQIILFIILWVFIIDNARTKEPIDTKKKVLAFGLLHNKSRETKKGITMPGLQKVIKVYHMLFLDKGQPC